MVNKLVRCAVYIRVSSVEQAKYGDSTRDQKERCVEYIDCHQNMVLQDVFLDDGVSGQKLDRGDFSRLLQAVKNNEIDLIIFTKLDRWFRSLRHYLNIQEILEEHNVAWTAIDQPYFDTSTPHGRAFVAQSMMWAELEAQNDGVRICDVFETKVKYGEVITGKVPRGYKIVNKHLVLTEEAPAIYDSIQYYIKEQSLNGTLRYMKERYGITMSIQNLKESILKNTKYTGKYRGNDKYCPRLISDADFEKISLLLSRNIKSSQKYDYIFSGLLVCKECGLKMSSGKINVKCKKPSGKIYRYKYPAYECKSHNSARHCENGGEIRETTIEKYMLDNVRTLLNDYVAQYESSEAVGVDNRAVKAKIRRKIDRLKELYLDEAISLDEFKRDRVKLEQQLNELPDVVKPVKDLTGIKQFLDSDFESIYISLNNKEKRKFWRSFIKEIKISKSHNRKRYYEIIFL